MRDFLVLGGSPIEEPCVQMSAENYYPKMYEECQRLKRLLELKFPKYSVHECQFGVKRFEHDFGPYCEVVIYFNDENDQSVSFAYDVESNLPMKWED